MGKRKLAPTIVIPEPAVATAVACPVVAYHDYGSTYNRLARDIVPGFDGSDFMVYRLAAVVCEQTGLQPSEFIAMPTEGRCAFVMRTAEWLELKAASVDLQRIGEIVGLSKKGMAKYKDLLGRPEVKGRGSSPDAWLWSRIRPILQKQFPRAELPLLP